MAHKTFYEAAAAEVAAGYLDRALWIKVNAEMAGADDNARRAKYIALRAQELAVESAAYRVRRFWKPHSFWTWVAYLVAAFIIAVVIGNIAEAMGTASEGGLLGLMAFGAVMLAAIILGVTAGHGAVRPAAVPSSTPGKST